MAPFSAFSSWFSPLGILATLIGLAAISLASLSPVGSSGDPGSANKTMHVVAYALTVLPLSAVPSRPRFGIALGALFWSGSIELLQPLVGRSASSLDLVANIVGILLGFSAAVLLSRFFRHAPR
jgi:hypothetical protein